MQNTQYIILFLSLVVSLCSLIIVFIYRKKDFQVTILKEQMSAYRELIEMVFSNNQQINEAYSKYINAEQLLSNPEYEKQLPLLHLQFFQEYRQYSAHYNKFQTMIYLLPEDVLNATLDYFGYIVDLFENKNEEYLGTKLLVDLNQKSFTVVNVIRQHIGVDSISQANMGILSAGKQQMKLHDEVE